MSATTIRKVVADNVKRLRNARGWSQQDLGNRIGVVTGSPWTRAAVSQMENGKDRPFTANDLLVLGLALRVLPGSLLLADPMEVSMITLEGTEAAPMALEHIQRPGDLGDPESTANRLRELLTLFEGLQERSIAQQDALDAAQAALSTAKREADALADATADSANLIRGLLIETLRYAQGSTPERSED